MNALLDEREGRPAEFVLSDEDKLGGSWEVLLDAPETLGSGISGDAVEETLEVIPWSRSMLLLG